MKKTLVSFFITLCLLLTLPMTVSAENKPFAEKKVVLQISDADPFKQTLVLNVANNLIKHYGQDRVNVEIVAFGPGMKLLVAKNKNKQRVSSLSDQGVTFSACSNTIKAMTKKAGKPIKLSQAAKAVPAGVVQIMDLVGNGYTLIKP